MELPQASMPQTTRPRSSRILGPAILVGLPLLLIFGFYYRPLLKGEPLPLDGDACFYAYQLERTSELHGRWWQIGADPSLGEPYPTIVAKHPGIYEGVDLMLLSAVAGRFLSPLQNYHFMVISVLAFNGWVAGWLVRRLTGSYLWAAVAVVLITLNVSTAFRLNAHLHLFKHGWVLLALWAFWRCLESPSAGRAVVLGVCAAMVLQGSFYFGFLLTLAMAIVGVVHLLLRRWDCRQWLVVLLAGGVYAAVGAALTFPVWTTNRNTPLSELYFHRYASETNMYSAPPWQYFTAPHWKQTISPEVPVYSVGEGWNYPGLAILSAVALYLIFRLRGWRPTEAYCRFVDLGVAISLVLVLLSLKNGPSLVIAAWVTCFRCYGRGGLIAVGILCAVAPVIFCLLLSSVRRTWLRLTMVPAVVALAAFDGVKGQEIFHYGAPPEVPGWVSWLSEQPAGVRLAAFSAWEGNPLGYQGNWFWDSLYYRTLHHHQTLNGCEFNSLEADLRLLGTSYGDLNAAGLRYIASLGYDTLAFHDDYLATHSWVASAPWLTRVDGRDRWQIYRVNQAGGLPAAAMTELLARVPALPLKQIPAACWITDDVGLDRAVLVGENPGVRLTWTAVDGRTVGKPSQALFQHVFGPGIPAFTVLSPIQPGRYALNFLDQHGRCLASRLYEVVKGLHSVKDAFGEKTPPLHVGMEPGHAPGVARRIVVANPTRFYVQAFGDRPQAGRSVRSHPGMFDLRAPWAGALTVVLWHHPFPDQPAREIRLLLPHDLPPGGRCVLDVSDDLLTYGSRSSTAAASTGEILDVRIEQVPLPIFAD
jgi:hypothetical protein